MLAQVHTPSLTYAPRSLCPAMSLQRLQHRETLLTQNEPQAILSLIRNCPRLCQFRLVARVLSGRPNSLPGTPASDLCLWCAPQLNLSSEQGLGRGINYGAAAITRNRCWPKCTHRHSPPIPCVQPRLCNGCSTGKPC